MASFHHRIKSGKKVTARAHASYIERDGKFANRGEDLVHTGYGNMPEWAENNPKLFWKMADKHERVNGAVYREHEVALPNELKVEQLISLTEKIAQELVGNKPYQYAIHAPEGSLCKRRRETVPLKRPNSSVAAVQKCTAPVASSSLPSRQMAGGGGCTAWRCINDYGVPATSMA